MNFEIIDFHTHPFLLSSQNICNHIEFCNMSPEHTLDIFGKMGISKICGGVIALDNKAFPTLWDKVRDNNDTALALWEQYGDFYIPGFHIHPDYVEESIAEIHMMHAKGIKLIGELVPYIDGWSDDCLENLTVILKEAAKYSMVVSFHTGGHDFLDDMVAQNRDIPIVAAHPGECDSVLRHIARMKKYDNCYLDLSGTGLFRYGVLRRLIDEVGADRILFGSDYPTCNPAMFLGGVMNDPLITDAEKEKILSLNAKKLLFT